ncbi:MAG: RNA methyltransferase, partial [Clostridia bacterium]|nr:RNA methyltransferase [Clostridia bacterium]
LSCEYIRYIGEPLYLFVLESCRDKYHEHLCALERECGLSLTATLVSEGAFMKLTDQKAPDGIIAVGECSKLCVELVSEGQSFDFSSERIIALSSLRDAGNVGTVIRSALALGYDRIIMSSDCADIFNPKTLRATMGAAFSMRFAVCESLSFVVERLVCAGRRVYCAEIRENARPLDEIEISESDVFVVGNEGHGIDTAVSSVSTSSVYIPISSRSESLNAAIAASLLMWHQRTKTFSK